jgi:hypothetical protein
VPTSHARYEENAGREQGHWRKQETHSSVLRPNAQLNKCLGEPCLLYAERDQATSVSQGRSRPRRLTSSASPRAAFCFRLPDNSASAASTAWAPGCGSGRAKQPRRGRCSSSGSSTSSSSSPSPPRRGGPASIAHGGDWSRTKSSQRVPTLEERNPNCDSSGDEGEAGDSAELNFWHGFSASSGIRWRATLPLERGDEPLYDHREQLARGALAVIEAGRQRAQPIHPAH